MVTTTGGCRISVSHRAVLFLSRMAALLRTIDLVQQERRLLQDRCNIGHEAGGQVAVHHAVVE